MKKKIAFVLSLLLVTIMLGACGTDPTTVDYNGYSYQELEYVSSGLITNLVSMPETDLQYYLANGDELTQNIISSWMENTADLGDYLSYDSFSITKSGKTLTTDMIVHFTDRDVVFEIVYNYYDMSVPTGVTVEPVYSLGEKMAKAGMNTIISMLVVFCVLILISLIIYAFNIFPYLEKKKKEKAEAAAKTNSVDQVVTQIEQREEQQSMDDTELIAVIAAAIAASEGTSTSDFVVRSINRR